MSNFQNQRVHQQGPENLRRLVHLGYQLKSEILLWFLPRNKQSVDEINPKALASEKDKICNKESISLYHNADVLF
jgi:hypothetical protein